MSETKGDYIGPIKKMIATDEVKVVSEFKPQEISPIAIKGKTGAWLNTKEKIPKNPIRCLPVWQKTFYGG